MCGFGATCLCKPRNPPPSVPLYFSLFSLFCFFFFLPIILFIYLFVIYCHYFYYVFSFILSGGWIRHTPIMLVKFSVAYVREAYSIGICINAFIFLYIYIHAHCVFHFCFSRFFFSSSFSSSSSPGPDRNRNRICAVNKVFSKKKKIGNLLYFYAHF